MEEEELIKEIQLCADCLICNEQCDTYIVTQDPIKSPNGRLKIVKKVFENIELEDDELIGLYTCTLCGLCDLVCQENISITDIILQAKMRLVELNKAPLEIHNKIIKGILDTDNSVNGNPGERLEWIPDKFKNQEIFEKKDTETLLFLGCMSSFRVKESAFSSYELLKKADFNFKILEKEPCCGEYIYSAGNLKLSKEIFNQNYNLFKKNGISRIICTCGGCFYAFNEVYPKYIKNWDIEVKHIVQIIHDLFKKDKLKFKRLNKSITYHDSCRTGRKLQNLQIFDEPRELLKHCSSELNELNQNRNNTPCCGAGSGIRGVDSSISIKIGKNIFKNLKSKEIVSSCPLCVFNYRYVNYKTNSDIEATYITDFLLKALENK